MTYIKEPNNDVTKSRSTKKNSQNLKVKRITNQKVKKLLKLHVYIVKYRCLNIWDTHVPMGTKGLTVETYP